jgi:hypothetical protein
MQITITVGCNFEASTVGELVAVETLRGIHVKAVSTKTASTVADYHPIHV